jgi:hypothetical protein
VAHQGIRIAGLIAAEVVLVAGLHALFRLDVFPVVWSDWPHWLDDTAFEDAVGSVVLVVALGLAYWLLLSTVAYVLASFSGRSVVVAALRWWTLPPIRRLAGRAVALSLAASAVAGSVTPAAAHLAERGSALEVIVEADGRGQFHPQRIGMISTGEDERPDVIVPLHLRPAPAVAAAGAPPLDGSISHQVTVRRNDHLWSLSERHLQQVLGRPPLGEHEITRYWLQVIETNRGTIRSGNPDLIYPGEVITLPIVVFDP